MSSITQKLTQKQQRFVDEYIISGNATQAAIKAGYSKKTARFVGAENLTKPNIKAELEKRNAEIKSQKTMDMQEVMERLAAIARGETVEQQVTNKGTVVEVEPKTSDQIRAMELIGKRYGAWTDKKEVTGGLEINVGVGDWNADD
ncbi:terminase small subunit [Ligilactobacillus salivarius]|uniref:terminase small subunit n=1 Tax=Ligilactobacillus salivarius TaxID=1624 RepID=UPI00202345F6|nr:terminase small subunit [Ligilactobacillus salivarius]URI13459.1 terminase small subunit [Ligilactobacillus salivarius]UUB35296.1 terminase small subunit [Ligilactobacillus salivarius]